MYRALYREYRPEVFSEMLGQEHIVRILRHQLETDSTSHAYLFCGTRGTGKTTTARLLAKGLNCTSEGARPCGQCDACNAIREGNFLDVIEIDAASNNGVDNIRELRESVKYPPAVGRRKVYIIDEVHMLSAGAFNALLKTLEEPPEYVTFILATTEPDKLPATILSRCMRLDFKRVPENILVSGLADICSRKGIEVSEDALRIIAANADGSVRDGLSILDQCIAGGDAEVSAKDVLDFLGASGEEAFVELTDMVRKGKTADALVYVAHILADGKDVKQFIKDWINHFRNLLMTKYIDNPQDVINMSVENIERIRRQSQVLELMDINNALMELSRLNNEARYSSQPRILLELAIVRLSTGETTVTPTVQKPSIAKSSVKTGTAKVMNSNVQVKDKMPEADKTAPEERTTGFDCNSVWKAVFDDVEAGKGSFYVLASDGRITEIKDNEFSLVVDKPFQSKMAENNRELIERLVAQHTDGRKRHMKILSSAESSNHQEDGTKVNDTARMASEMLGIDVEII